MMQPTQNRTAKNVSNGPQWHATPVHPSLGTNAWHLMVVFHVRQQHVTKMSFAKDEDIINALQRMEPISRSAYPFCQGERGDVGRSRIPIDRNIRMKISP